MNTRINEFVFKGLMASHAARDLRTAGLLRTPANSPEELRDHDLFVAASDRIRSSSKQMQRYYRLLFVFENSVREFITSSFEEADGENWFDTRSNTEMKKKYENRKQSEEKNSWHVGRNAHPIYYLDFGDLALLIINHWNLFKDLFPDQAWVTSRIKETERTRNVIAHTNELSSAEGSRLEMHLRDWIAQVGG